MFEKGYRLVRTEKQLYEFEKCKSDEGTHCVGVHRRKIKKRIQKIMLIFEDMGYKVFFKNINLNHLLEKFVGAHGQKGAVVLRQTQQLLIEKS